MKQKFIFPVVCVLFAAAGCTSPDLQFQESPESSVAVQEAAGFSNDAVPVVAPLIRKAKSNSAVQNFQTPEGRKMVFTADLSLQVTDAKKAAAETRKLIAAEGGYVKNMNNTTLTLAVPVQKGDAFLDKLSAMGEVINLQIDGNDVTEQAADLKIRMENLEKSRKRLLLLMDRTADVKDLTQVERELNRVTTELERLQASEKNLSTRISYITLTVRFQTVHPVVQAETARLPLEWVNELGSDLRSLILVTGKKQKLPFAVTLPEKFMFAGGEYAVSGKNCHLRFRELSNVPVQIRWYGKTYAETDFYKDLVMESLKVRFNGEITCEECQIDGLSALKFQGTTTIGNVEYLYLLAIAADGKEVKLIEACGKKDQLLKDLPPGGWETLLKTVDF